MIVDTHSHIHFVQSFPDLEDVIKRAREAGVAKQVLVGCNPEDSENAFEFASEREGFVSTWGVHPHDSNLWKYSDDLMQLLAERKAGGKLVAIGEIGLDYFRNMQPVEVQKAAFRGQLEMAMRLDLPVVLHIRDAFEDVFTILDEMKPAKALLHCFSGTMKEADWAWSRGYKISLAGVVTYSKNLDLQEVAKKASTDGFVVETDCPYLAPQKYRGQRNEPAFVAETVRYISELRQEDVALMTTKTAEAFFKI